MPNDIEFLKRKDNDHENVKENFRTRVPLHSRLQHQFHNLGAGHVSGPACFLIFSPQLSFTVSRNVEFDSCSLKTLSVEYLESPQGIRLQKDLKERRSYVIWE